MNDPRICKCGHWMKQHEYLDQSLEDMIACLVKCGTITVIHHPDRMAIAGFQMKDDTHFVPYHQMIEVLTDIRANRARCKGDGMGLWCRCENFNADNLKYLEILSERK